MQYVWVVWSLILLLIWLLVYITKKNLRREMLWASIWTAPLRGTLVCVFFGHVVVKF